MKFWALSVNKPTIRKGMPNPNEYDTINGNADAGLVTANVKIAPKIAPTQGVQPTAKALPKTNEVRYEYLNFLFTFSLCSFSKKGIFTKPKRYIPKKMINAPPI